MKKERRDGEKFVTVTLLGWSGKSLKFALLLFHDLLTPVLIHRVTWTWTKSRESSSIVSFVGRPAGTKREEGGCKGRTRVSREPSVVSLIRVH